MNRTIFEMENRVGWINSRRDFAEEKTSELGEVQQQTPNMKHRDKNKHMHREHGSVLYSFKQLKYV